MVCENGYFALNSLYSKYTCNVALAIIGANAVQVADGVLPVADEALGVIERSLRTQLLRLIVTASDALYRAFCVYFKQGILRNISELGENSINSRTICNILLYCTTFPR